MIYWMRGNRMRAEAERNFRTIYLDVLSESVVLEADLVLEKLTS